MQPQMFLGINFVEKYFTINYLCGLSTENYLLTLLCFVQVEGQVVLESPFIYFF